MKERRAVREEQERLPKAPLSARTPRATSDWPPAVPAEPRGYRDGNSDFDAPKTRSPAWTPDSPRHPPVEEADKKGTGERFIPSRGSTTCSTPRGERQLSRGLASPEELNGARPKVRGPSEARAAREGGHEADEDDDIPRQAKGADFRTLQEMIARGISESESGASKMEATLKAVDNSDEELLRQKEALRQRREDAEQARQKEREKAKLQRQKEWEERNRQFQEEMERNEQEELQARR